MWRGLGHVRTSAHVQPHRCAPVVDIVFAALVDLSSSLVGDLERIVPARRSLHEFYVAYAQRFFRIILDGYQVAAGRGVVQDYSWNHMLGVGDIRIHPESSARLHVEIGIVIEPMSEHEPGRRSSCHKDVRHRNHSVQFNATDVAISVEHRSTPFAPVCHNCAVFKNDL